MNLFTSIFFRLATTFKVHKCPKATKKQSQLHHMTPLFKTSSWSLRSARRVNWDLTPWDPKSQLSNFLNKIWCKTRQLKPFLKFWGSDWGLVPGSATTVSVCVKSPCSEPAVGLYWRQSDIPAACHEDKGTRLILETPYREGQSGLSREDRCVKTVVCFPQGLGAPRLWVRSVQVLVFQAWCTRDASRVGSSRSLV